MKMMYRNWEKFDKIFMICIKVKWLYDCNY